jgi:hypothetical protein
LLLSRHLPLITSAFGPALIKQARAVRAAGWWATGRL